MHAAADRLEFAPPHTPGTVRALGFAIMAHALLLAALTWGVNWKSQPNNITAEAELWSAVPQQAAPRLEEPPPPPPEPPAPVVKPSPPVVAPKLPDADIALEREKQRLEKEKLEKQEQDKLAREKKLKDKLAKDKLAKEKLAKDKLTKEKLALEKKAADEKKQKELEAKRKDTLKEQQDAKLQEKRRQENIQRMTGLAGATGGPQATGSALQASGPSAGYAGRIRARIKPNIVFTEDITGNPTAEVEVRTAPDGTIISRKLLKSSGVKSWDEAVLKAIDKTEVLPRDVDGRVPSMLMFSFRPRD
jgi:colicin import membrane protein